MTELETQLLKQLEKLQSEQEKRNNDLMTLWNERESALQSQISSLQQQINQLSQQVIRLSGHLEQQNNDNLTLATALQSLHQQLMELANE